MSYIKKIFQKDIDQLTISDLNSFFETEQEETSVLEFKSGDVEIHDIYKEIGAFLNTEGGLLIIGAPREKKVKVGKNEKVFCKGPLTYSKYRNKDWLYQKICSNITPTPIGLKIFEHLDTQGNVFVIDIPQSSIPPHQCSSDGRYYIRLERDAKPAPHGLVQALFLKRRLPKLDASINFTRLSDFSDKVIVSVKNNSNIPADKVSLIIDVYNVLNVESDHRVRRLNDTLGLKYSISENAGQVLVQVISMPVEIIVTHEQIEYMVLVGYWCKDTDFDFKFWTYSPTEMKISCEDRMLYDKVIFTDELKRIQK